ncbi:MAG: hypothetical protein WAO58_00980 [Fimbriimonadaceae bacterium]
MKAQERPIEAGYRRRRRFPWLLFLLLLGSVYLFWVFPNYQMDLSKVKVEFSNSPQASPETPGP